MLGHFDGGIAMDFGFLKSFTDSIKNSVEALWALDKHLAKYEREALAAAARKKLEETAKALRDFSVEGTYEYHTLAAEFIPAVRNFMEEQSEENWKKLEANVISAVEGLEILTRKLYANADLLGSQDFFDPLLESLVQRRALLNKLSAMPVPTTAGERRDLRDFLVAYNEHMQVFRAANGELRRHIEKILQKS